ncbi:MAG: acyl dehydratase [Pseudonocardiales bacterium]|nr:acyl dehydratase [Pseudonocardiales bacterium]
MNKGDRHQHVLTEGLTRTQIVQYAGSSGDYNPVHTDEVFAVHAGFPSVFAHGMLTMAMTARALTDWVGAESLTGYGVRFKKQVWPGDRLVATIEVDDIRTDDSGQELAELIVTTHNGAGDEVISGYATARI